MCISSAHKKTFTVILYRDYKKFTVLSTGTIGNKNVSRQTRESLTFENPIFTSGPIGSVCYCKESKNLIHFRVGILGEKK